MNIVYRIKDLDTGKYYKNRKTVGSPFYNSDIKKVNGYTYKVVEKTTYGYDYETYIFLDDIGNFYNTKKGAEKIISELTKCSLNNRKTTAGRLLNSKFNFVVVKSEITARDIKDSDATLIDTP